MSIYQFRLPYCGSVPLVTQTLNEYSASCMRKSCPIRSGTEPCGPWRSFLRDKSRVSDGIQACICICSSSPFHWIYVCNILIFPTLFSFNHLFNFYILPAAKYRLVIICSNEDEDKSHIISQLSTNRKLYTVPHDIAKFQKYLKTHFTSTTPTHQSHNVTQEMSASIVDCEEWV